MTRLLGKAIEQIFHPPDARQDEAAEILLSRAAREAGGAPRPSAMQVEEAKRRQAAPAYATDAILSPF